MVIKHENMFFYNKEWIFEILYFTTKTYINPLFCYLIILVYMDAGVASNAGTIDISTALANSADGTKSWRVCKFIRCED